MLARALARRRVKSKADLGDLPSFPAIIGTALRQLRDPSAALAEVGEALISDPRISAKLLRMANSTAFALRNPVRSVPHAVSLLGRGTTESLLLAAVVSGISGKAKNFDGRAFWVSGARRGLMARAIAADISIGKESESFTEGLLQDMAVPYLLRTVNAYEEILAAALAGEGTLVELENSKLGYNHATVAGWMAERWEFPQPLCEALSRHHESESTPGCFVARHADAEEDAFLEAASSSFEVSSERAARWFQEAQGAEEFASLLVG
ncbi:MAG: HDOD domain-containing protein [Polyangiales bacterium]